MDERRTATTDRRRSLPRQGLSAARVIIEAVTPQIDGGTFAAKRTPGETVDVSARIFADGHDILSAVVAVRPVVTNDDDGEDGGEWHESPMALLRAGDDLWHGSFIVTQHGWYEFRIIAWVDRFQTWRRDLRLKAAAGQAIDVELLEGSLLVRETTEREEADDTAAAAEAAADRQWLLLQADGLSDSGPDVDRLAIALSPELATLMTRLADRSEATVSDALPVWVDRERARFGAWYEFFPRSASPDPARGGTFRDAATWLPRIADLGFDVIYLPPIHPIGHSFRKGRNNSLESTPDDVGSPWAIGSEAGGHDAVDPGLGTIDDFVAFRCAAERLGLEVALDLAWQCSPDHPWVREHPEWFRHRPDGTIKYAENPPKRYQDIYPLDFACAEWRSLWRTLLDVTLFWVSHGVRIFRVDNPHTKSLNFWAWLIREVQARHADVLFLSEAFTRPKVMASLAKLGFTQSYTYFTWRTTKAELQEYLSELTAWPVREFFNPNFFVTTPDILPVQLQRGDAWLFKSRVALAAMLSSTYGIYNGFELVEHKPLPGKEEYLDSEKYEFKTRDWNAPGNIKDYIAGLNRLRRSHKALQQTTKLNFLQVDHDGTIGFLKHSVDGAETLAIAIAVTGPDAREFWLHFGDNEIGSSNARRRIVAVENLQTGERIPVQWGGVRLRLDPNRDPMIALRCV